MTGCAGIGAGDTALCRELAGPAARLSDALAAHPETPDAVGEPATDALVIAQGGCP